MDKTCIIIEWDGATAKATMYGSEYKLKYSAAKTDDEPDMQKSILRVVEKLTAAANATEPKKIKTSYPKYRRGTVVLTKYNNVVQIDEVADPSEYSKDLFVRKDYQNYKAKPTDIVYRTHVLFSASNAHMLLAAGDLALVFEDDISEVFK